MYFSGFGYNKMSDTSQMYKIKAIDDYNNGKEVGEYASEKPVLKTTRKPRAKGTEPASVEEDRENEPVTF